MEGNQLKLKGRYPIVDGKQVIELHLKTPHQLMDERDPSPFRERDLDDDAARYIVSSFNELSQSYPSKLLLHFTELGAFNEDRTTITNAIHSHFEYEAELKRRELKQTFKRGFVSLLIGLSFLLVCMYTHIHFLQAAPGTEDLFGAFVREGLFIMGWVAMWQPITIFLYEWWPIREAQVVFQDLAHIEIEVRLFTEAATEKTRAGDPVQTSFGLLRKA